MSKGLITRTYLEDIANAIREKYKSESTLLPSEMASAILALTGYVAAKINVPFNFEHLLEQSTSEAVMFNLAQPVEIVTSSDASVLPRINSTSVTAVVE